MILSSKSEQGIRNNRVRISLVQLNRVTVQNRIIERNSEPLPPAKRDETLPCALFLFIGKCMEIIVQLIAEEIRVVEFHSPHPKFFRCGSIFSDMGDCINSEQHVLKQFAAKTELCYFSGRASV